jgi:hypothetical protein
MITFKGVYKIRNDILIGNRSSILGKVNTFNYLGRGNLKEIAARAFEMSVNFYQTTRRNIPEDSHLRG